MFLVTGEQVSTYSLTLFEEIENLRSCKCEQNTYGINDLDGARSCSSFFCLTCIH